jgi:hypothetical protein
MMPAAATHPQQKPPEDVLDVVRALARLAARVDHEAELARRKPATGRVAAQET